MTRRHRGDRRRSRRTDAGFTLPELLVAIVIMPLIIGAVATAVITLFNQTSPNDPHGAQTRLLASDDAQLTSAYYVRDVESATTIYTPGGGGTWDYSTWQPCGSGTPLLGLQWANGSTEVLYSVSTGASPALDRYFCGSTTSKATLAANIFNGLSNPSPSLTTNNGDVVLSSGNGSVSFTVSCSPACSGTGPYQLTGPKAVVVTSVQLAVQENLNGYKYSITGTPSLSNGGGGGTSGPPGSSVTPPLLIDPQGSAAYPPLYAGNCSMQVNGVAAVDAPNSGSVYLDNKGNITASGIYTADASDPSGAMTGPGGQPKGSYPQPPLAGGQITDPYSVLTPTAPTVSESSYGGYPVYVETANPWTPQGQLNPGIYIVEHGMKLAGSNGVSGNVLIYVTGGNVDLSGQGNVLLQSLDPYWEGGYAVQADGSRTRVNETTPTPPTLPEPVLWVASTDTGATVTLGGNGNATTINGAIYAPTASVQINGGGNGGSVSADQLEAGSLSCNGGGRSPDNVLIGTLQATGTIDYPTNSTIALGNSDTDTATVEAPPNTTLSGTVTFYLCDSSIGCDSSTGVQVGSPVTLPASTNGSSTATSPPVTPVTEGSWCFAAYFTPASSTSLYPSADTSQDGCFTVLNAPNAPDITYPTSSGPNCYSSPGGSCPQWEGAITGTATDSNGTVLSVQVAIQQPGNGTWWDALTGTWVPSQTWNQATGTSTWDLPFSNFPPGDTGYYTVWADATDVHGTGPASSVSFEWAG